ncbi:MAG: chitobiase/beta-hexosaminidase C-terminal domain-containing protein, partial [Muribaculaceae bacterium]|nr:chitobiase/beta-hexosaminidase C-terminal domain-containing protein [Muribaculaceae bacterium]
MRKFLLLSLLTLFASVTALADVAAFIPKGSTMYKGTAPDDKKVTLPDGTVGSSVFTIDGVISMQVEKVSTNNAQVTSSNLRVYIGDKIIFTPADGVTITKISVKCSGTSYLGGTVSTSWGKITQTTATATPFTWEPATDGTSQPESFSLVGTKQIRAQYIEIEYTASSQPGTTVTAPVITLLENNTVEITQEDGDDIYYTTDGTTEPTTASTPYTGTFTISGVTTVKAVAVNNDGEYSKVITKILTPNVVNSIAEFISYKPSAATRINTPVTVIYKNGRNMYLKDANDSFILAYNTNNLAAVTDLTAVNGDMLSYITGTYHSQGGLDELVPTAIGEKTSGTPVEPYEVNVANIDVTMLNQYVKFGPVKIEAQTKDNNYTATDADGNTITIYNTFYNSTYYDVVTVEEGEGFTVTGFVGVYNNTVQITPIAIEGGTVIETVATPVFSVASGAVEEGTSVEITCATDGATIYYTDDNTTPSATNGYTYIGTPISITDAVTIKAIAVLD